MYPTLLSLGSFKLDSFFAMSVLGAALAFSILHSRLRAEGVGTLEIQALFLSAFFLSVLISRLWHFAENPGEFTIPGLLSPHGLRWHAFLIGGVVTMLIGAPLFRIERGRLFDAAAMAVAPGQAIGRIGCLLVADSCNGVPCDLPWGVTLKTGAMTIAEKIHPTPIYESINLLIITAILIWADRKGLRPWVITFLYLLLSGLQRFIVQFWRADLGVFGPLTNYHYMALLSALIGAAGLLFLRKQGPLRVP